MNSLSESDSAIIMYLVFPLLDNASYCNLRRTGWLANGIPSRKEDLTRATRTTEPSKRWWRASLGIDTYVKNRLYKHIQFHETQLMEEPLYNIKTETFFDLNDENKVLVKKIDYNEDGSCHSWVCSGIAIFFEEGQISNILKL